MNYLPSLSGSKVYTSLPLKSENFIESGPGGKISIKKSGSGESRPLFLDTGLLFRYLVTGMSSD